MRYVAVITVLLTAVAPLNTKAATVVCTDYGLDTRNWVEKRLEEADVVLLGKVISAEFPDPPEPTLPGNPTARSMKELLEMIEKATADPNPHHQNVSLEVLEAWKGPLFRVFIAKNSVVPGQYGVPLKVGKSYLVFAYKQEDGIYIVSTVCGDTKLEENASERIDVLNELAEADKSSADTLH